MNWRNELDQPVGGYLEIELPKPGEHYHRGLRLNSGRSCLAYVLQSRAVDKLYIPYFICDSVIEPIVSLGISYEFYSLDGNFEIIGDVRPGKSDMLLLVNYFGLKTSYIERLVKRYSSQVIVDNTQAFFNVSTAAEFMFCSPRKYFGVPDGGYLLAKSRVASPPMNVEVYQDYESSHLLGRIEFGAEKGYEAYQDNEARLKYSGIYSMSNLSDRILRSIDYHAVRLLRNDNFAYLHSQLAQYNELELAPGEVSGPFCYPLLVRKEGVREALISHRIFVPRFWTEVCDRGLAPASAETVFATYLLPLPVDQRYSAADMQRIVDCIRSYLGDCDHYE